MLISQMVFVGTSEVIFVCYQNKYISPKRMERKQVQFIIFKNLFFSNLKTLNFFSYHGEASFLIFIFIFQVIYGHTCYVLSITFFYCGSLMLSGFDKLAQWPLILFSKNKLISNASYKESLCYSKSDVLAS